MQSVDPYWLAKSQRYEQNVLTWPSINKVLELLKVISSNYSWKITLLQAPTLYFQSITLPQIIFWFNGSQFVFKSLNI